MSSESYVLDLGRPLNDNTSESTNSSFPSSNHTQGSLSGQGVSGDHVSKSMGHSGAGAAGVIGGTGGEGRDTSYETTNPKSGYQALGDGESEPHSVRGSGGGGGARGATSAFGAAGGDFGTESGASDFGSATVTGREKYGGLNESGSHAGSAHNSTGFNSSTFPSESDTLTSGEAGKFGTENSARRNDGLLEQTEQHHSNGYDGITPKGFVSSEANSGRASTATHSHGHSTGTGLAAGGAALAGAGAGGAAYGSHSNTSNITSSNTSNNTSGSPNDLTIGGFNPKTTASDLNTSVPSGKEVEHLSTDGPHGLVWKESEQKYVHRREL